MESSLVVGVSLAAVSGVMNGSFTLPMRFLGRWEWEHVWSLFILVSCLVMPAAIVSIVAPQSWVILLHAPAAAIAVAVLTGLPWGFGAVLFGQSVSAIGISLANTLVLAISSALGSLLPMLLPTPARLFEPEGHRILIALSIQVLGIALCGCAGRMRELESRGRSDRGDLVGRARPLGVALLMAAGSGVLSAVFNTGFALAKPVADYGRAAGLSDFASTNLIWLVMLASGSIANLGFCGYLFAKNGNLQRFAGPASARLYSLSGLMALLWGGSIFVYGAAAPRLGALGTSIGWPLSLAVGLVLANGIGIGLGEWRQASFRARGSMYLGIAVLLMAIVALSRVAAG